MRPAESPDLPSHGLTERQRRIIQVIEHSVGRDGYWPTVREIGEAAGMASPSSVSYQLRRLEEKGFLTRCPGRSRAIALRPTGEGAVPDHADPAAEPPGAQRLAQVPLAGRIAAGRQILATELVEDVMPLPRQLVGEGDFIMLRVAGDSMIGAAIADGDLVVVRTRSDVENGDIVAAMTESDSSDDLEATVKTFRRRDGHVWLEPRNPAFEPRIADNAEILGKVVAVLRRV